MKNAPELQRHSMFTITDVVPRAYAPGDWVTGWIYGFHFQALVFFEHAKNPAWEIARSRISKLELKEPDHDRVVYSWDRGADIPAADYGSEVAVEFLSKHLADLVYMDESERRTGMHATASTACRGVKSKLKHLFIRLWLALHHAGLGNALHVWQSFKRRAVADCKNENQSARNCQGDSRTPEIVFEALVKRFGGDREKAKDYMTDAYCGEYPDMGWYAATFVNDLYHEQMAGLPDLIRNHVDWDSVGRAVLQDGTVFAVECDGVIYVFDSEL